MGVRFSLPAQMKIPLLVILGPTATGKSDLAVEVAHRIGGEIISADSRQVYKGLDIGTGKITHEEMRGIPHHCLDIADPHNRFTVMDWKKAAEEAIEKINSSGKIIAENKSGHKKLPIICGGTGFYISTLVDDLGFPDIENDPAEQEVLEAKDVDELFVELQKLDPRRAKDMEKNKRRIIRAILVARKLGAVPELKMDSSDSKYETVMIGLSMSDEDLKRRIKDRVLKRLDEKCAGGMIKEAEKLHAGNACIGDGLSYERMEELGLEYRYLARYLQGQITREDFIEQLSTKIWQYARRQKTWFKRDNRIEWFDPRDPMTVDKICKNIERGIHSRTPLPN